MFQKYGLVPDGLETLYGKTRNVGERALGGWVAWLRGRRQKAASQIQDRMPACTLAAPRRTGKTCKRHAAISKAGERDQTESKNTHTGSCRTGAAHPATSSTQKPGHLPTNTITRERQERHAHGMLINSARNERQQTQVQADRNATADGQSIILTISSATHCCNQRHRIRKPRRTGTSCSRPWRLARCTSGTPRRSSCSLGPNFSETHTYYPVAWHRKIGVQRGGQPVTNPI